MLAWVDRKRFEAQVQALALLEIFNKMNAPKPTDFNKLQQLGINVEWQ